MSKNNLNLKWVHSGCKLCPAFITSSKICFACDNYIRVTDVESNCHRSYLSPGKGISCLTTIPELAVIGLSENCERPQIFVITYPSFRVVSTIRYGAQSPYVALSFCGLDYLVSVCGKPDNDVTLWDWRTEQKLHSTLQSCCYVTDCSYRLTLNPSYWFQLCLQQNMSLTIVEVKASSDGLVLQQRCLVSPTDNKKEYRIRKNDGHSSMVSLNMDGKKRISISSHCWLPDGNIIAACDDGTIIMVNVVDFNVRVLHCYEQKLVTSLAYNGNGLFLGKNDGYVVWNDITQRKWKFLENLNIGQSVVDLLFSPTFENLVAVSAQGSIFMYTAGEEHIKCIVSGDKTAIVGICILCPDSKYGITVRENGLIQVWCMATGKYVARKYIDDNVQNIVASPVCPVVVVCSGTRFLYFLDFTDVNNIRPVHVTKPYANVIDHVKFDNFGYYVVLASGQEDLSIFSGLPTSGFDYIGIRAPLGFVQDICIFTEEKDSNSNILSLCRSGNCHRYGVGDMLELFQLPADFLKDSSKYHQDSFKRLAEDMILVKKWFLDDPASKVQALATFGAVLYSPLSSEIRILDVWHNEVKSSKWSQKVNSDSKLCDLIVSPDHKYLICINQFSSIYVYNLADSEDSPVMSDYCSNDRCSYEIAYSTWNNSILIGSSKGIVACYEFNCYWYVETVIPRWLLECDGMSMAETQNLNQMEEEGVQLDTSRKKHRNMSQKTEKVSSNVADMFLKKLEIIDISFDYLISKSVCALEEVVLSGHEYHLHEESIIRLCSDNDKRSEKIKPEESGFSQSIKQQGIETLEGIKSSIEVSTYQLKKNSKVDENIKCNNVNLKQNVFKSVGDMLEKFKLLYVSSDGFNYRPETLQTESQKLELIQSLRNLVHDLQAEFNKNFEDGSKFKDIKIHSIKQKVTRVKELATLLKTDEPFWEAETGENELKILENQAILDESNNVSAHKTVENDWKSQLPFHRMPSMPDFMQGKPQNMWSDNEHKMAKKYENKCNSVSMSNMIKELEYLKKSIHEEISDVDNCCGNISELKTVCNFMIYEEEMKIFAVFLWLNVTVELSALLRSYETDIELLKSLVKPLKKGIEHICEIQKAAKEFYDILQKLERDMDIQAQQQFQEYGKFAEELYQFFCRRPPLESSLRTKLKNPYQPPLPHPLSIDELRSSLNTLEYEQPHEVDSDSWNTICDSRVWKFAAEEVLRCQTQHVMAIHHVLLQWKIETQEVKNEIKTLSNIIVKVKSLLMKSDDTISSLLYDKSKNNEVDLVLLMEYSNPDTDSNNSNVQTTPVTIWKAIELGIYKNKQLQSTLESVETKFDDIKNLRQGMESDNSLTKFKELSTRVKKLQQEMLRLEDQYNKNQAVMKDMQQSLLSNDL